MSDTPADSPGRHWLHPRPQPRRRRDLMGFNAIWWALLYLILIAVAIFPFPWWWS
jgi:hypothetical protein